MTAPAGWGTSRLANEFVRLMEGRDLAVWRAGADPLARGSSFAMLAALLRGLFGLVEGEPVEVRRQKIEARVARLLPASEIGFVVEFLGEIVGLTHPGRRRTASIRARGSRADRRADAERVGEPRSRRECAGRPLLIILEDLHFGDLADGALHRRGAPQPAREPVHGARAARPEVHDQFPDLWSERRVQQPAPAGAHSTRGAPSRARRSRREALRRRRPRRSRSARARNTFYLEELIRAVAENRGGALPETVLAMIASSPRAARVRRAAHLASRVGVRQSVLDRRRRDLDQRRARGRRRPCSTSSCVEFVAKVPTSLPRRSEFVFRHALVREAAYEMLTERDRQQAHRLASAWLEAAGERDAIVMAEHLERGGEPAGAVVWYLWAAEQALEGNDYPDRDRAREAQDRVRRFRRHAGEALVAPGRSDWAGAETVARRSGERRARLALPRGRARTPERPRSARRRERPARRSGRVATSRYEPRRREPIALRSASRSLSPIARTAIELYVDEGRSDWADPLVATIGQSAPGFEEDRPILETIRTWLAAARGLFSGCPELYAERGDELVASLEQHGQLRSAVLAEVDSTACAAVGADERAVLAAKRAIERAEART